MKPLGTYSFLPWLRQGLANQINSPDLDASVEVRAKIDVALEARGDQIGGGTLTAAVHHSVALLGPGDIVGIERRAIFRVEPRDWITNFEPNYLAHIEFYDEDYPWRYTPAAPDGGRLRPWITLIVLKESEFKDGTNMQQKPLPYIDVGDLSVFPLANELWAWAHVHVNRSLSGSDAEFVSHNVDQVVAKLQAALGENPDLAYSRLVCPRKLAANTAYHAFVVPTFESGRRAGLGIDIGNLAATKSAWDPGPRPEGASFPYYHRWFFRTGDNGDFETLVRLLQPKVVDPRVGTREMDVQAPGSNVAGVDKPELGGILKLGGALRPPHKTPAEPPDKFETWDTPFPRPLQEDLARLLNLPDKYQADGDPDPIITPPLYGMWHALEKRVLTERDGTPIASSDNWFHRLNLDPRFRVPAGFGTRVIQDQQEEYMNAAWEQLGKVLEAQLKIRRAQFSLAISQVWFDSHMAPILAVSPQKTLLLMAPLNKRILTRGATVFHAMSTSLVQPTMTSAALRRMVRPRGKLIRSLPFTAAQPADQLIARVNAGEVSAAPPKVAPPGVLTADQAADLVRPTGVPPIVADWLKRIPQLPLFTLIVAILLALLLTSLFFPWGIVVALIVLLAGGLLARQLAQWARALAASAAVGTSNQTASAVDALPEVSNFTITPVGTPFTPSNVGPDSVEAVRFKAALRASFDLVQASAVAGRPPVRTPLDLTQLVPAALQALQPRDTISKRVLAGIFVPPRILGGIALRPAEVFVEPMAYPVIDEPMYKPLKKLSNELFLPNINLIENNSITLLETNQRFIESYMVGLNHEFARELLWREYPTDQRPSTFRQFWDVHGVLNVDHLDGEALKEKLRDIPPLHLWSKFSELGKHNHRGKPGAGPDLVLVIRGELLKRYPTAVLYAHRACWQRKKVTPDDDAKDPCSRSGKIDNRRERLLAPLTAAEEAQPPTTKVRTPLYEAKVDPDIYFFGFPLTVEEAKGGTGSNESDDPGWFFVLKERPGEPRFGLDTERQTPLNDWNDLSWQDVQPKAAGAHIEIATSPATFSIIPPGAGDAGKTQQHLDDKNVAWSHAMTSVELAYILFQAPVLVAVHASEMLPK